MKYFFPIVVALLLFSCKGKKAETAADPDVYYTCSMDPQIKENKPGKCPICKMELTMARKSSHKNTGEIQLSEQQIQLGNIAVDTIRSGSMSDQTVLTATLSFDQLKTASISARAAGRLRRAPGQRSSGDPAMVGRGR